MAEKKENIGSKIMGGIRSLGSDIAMGIGAKDKTDDYRRRTANTVAVNRAIQRGDPSGLSDDLQSRYRREKMMAGCNSPCKGVIFVNLLNSNGVRQRGELKSF